MFTPIGTSRQVKIVVTTGRGARRTQGSGGSSRRRSIFWGL
jgi:hypothetical protein